MQVPIPLAALAIDDTQPQAGDPVDVTASGRITSIDGDTAMVEIETLNGAPMQAEPDGDEIDGPALRGMAARADAMPFGNP